MSSESLVTATRISAKQLGWLNLKRFGDRKNVIQARARDGQLGAIDELSFNIRSLGKALLGHPALKADLAQPSPKASSLVGGRN